MTPWPRLLASVALLSLACEAAKPSGAAELAAHSAQPSAAPSGSSSPGCQPGFADLAESADPAVVYIETLQADAHDGVGTLGLGSGFVVDPTGLILTNAHVIRDATRIVVVLQGRRLEAKVVGMDTPADVAVIKVPGEGLAHLELGNSDAVRVGDWVVAIGNPFGLAHTVSAGIISAKGRTRNDVDLDPAGYYSFLQTDASINPGNSGGPLLELGGRVVGVNTAIRAGANSIGFAIPIDMVKALLPRLVRDGKVQRSALGIVAVSLSAEKVVALGLDPKHPGVLVQSVAPAGPADKAGLREGDLVLEFDGEPVQSEEALRWVASIAGIGHTAELRLRRGPRTMTLRVVLGELQE